MTRRVRISPASGLIILTCPMSSTKRPYFTVIMATYGRGQHITPSIQSVLSQDFQDFELIVVGDHCQDDTEQAIAAVASPRLSWMNLKSRCASQSGPNNAGITASAGDVIAYIGHDDIWEASHLGDLAALLNTSPLLDCGCGRNLSPAARHCRQPGDRFV